MKSFDKLKIKIKQQTGLNVENLHRTYISRNQIEGWAWTWRGNLKGTLIAVGSWLTVKELLKSQNLKAKEDQWNQFEILEEE